MSASARSLHMSMGWAVVRVPPPPQKHDDDDFLTTVPLKTCDLSGHWTGDVTGKPAPLIVINQTGNLFEASAPGYWDATTTGGIARGIVSADGATVHGTGGWTHDLTTPWTLQVSALQSGAPACSKIATIVNGTATAAWCKHSLTPAHCGRPAPVPSPSFDSCPHQAANRLVTAAQFGSVYPSTATKVGVKFTTDDAGLQAVWDHAVSCEESNTKDFLPGLDCVVEGSNYKNVWLETQPMAGAMWATRNITNALANQLVFMRTQRDDGRLPGMVTTNNSAGAIDPVLTAVYCFHPHGKQTGGESLLQGDYFSSTSVDVAFFLNISDESTAKAYVTELHTVLERFDGWMWSARRSKLKGFGDVLWTPSSSDWGGDGYDGYNGLPAPFLSMDMMAYASSNALALARTSRILGNASGAAHWTAKQATVADSLKRALWIEDRGACYDIDANGQVVDVLVHNNLRAMWHGAFSQEMADTFVARHLRNTSEFWTRFPLPSISASDPKYKPGIPRNSWSGPAEGLTYQRAIRALGNYGYHAEITILGGKLLDAVAATPGYRFPQQWNPQAYNGTPAAAPGPGDCYGPALLSLLEYTVYAHGVKPRPADGVLLWSDAAVPNRQAATATYSQVLGDHTYTLVASTGTFRGFRDASELFTATRGVRVLTDGRGKVLGVVGISTANILLTLSVGAAVTKGTVEPNCEYELDGKGGLALTRRVPFKPLEPAELHASKIDDAGCSIQPVDAMFKVRLGEKPPPALSRPLAAARGELVHLQAVVDTGSRVAQTLRVSATSSAGSTTVREIAYTDLRAIFPPRTTSPGLMPDALLPADSNGTFSFTPWLGGDVPAAVRVFLVTINVSRAANLDQQPGHVSAELGSTRCTASFSVQVASFQMPSRPSQLTGAQWDPARVCQFGGGCSCEAAFQWFESAVAQRVTSQVWFSMGDKHSRLPWAPSYKFNEDKTAVELSTSLHELWWPRVLALSGSTAWHMPFSVHLYKESAEGQACQRKGPSSTRGFDKCTWEFVGADGEAFSVPIFRATGTLNPEFETAFRLLFKAVMGYLDAHGWGDSGSWVQVIDEPTWGDNETLMDTLAMMRLYRSIDPRIKIFQTRLPTPSQFSGGQMPPAIDEVFELVDWWCPHVCQWHEAGAPEQLAAHKHQRSLSPSRGPLRATLYNNGVPMIESPWQRVRSQAYAVWMTNGTLDGTLSWFNVNSWRENMWDAKFPNSSAKLQRPAGWGMLLWPPPPRDAFGPHIAAARPVESMRWVMLGAGIQDVEYLYALRGRADRNSTAMALLSEARAVAYGFPVDWNPSCGNKSYGDDGYAVEDPASATLGSSLINELKLKLGRALGSTWG
jgi:hypothetical protein